MLHLAPDWFHQASFLPSSSPLHRTIYLCYLYNWSSKTYTYFIMTWKFNNGCFTFIRTVITYSNQFFPLALRTYTFFYFHIFGILLMYCNVQSYFMRNKDVKCEEEFSTTRTGIHYFNFRRSSQTRSDNDWVFARVAVITSRQRMRRDTIVSAISNVVTEGGLSVHRKWVRWPIVKWERIH